MKNARSFLKSVGGVALATRQQHSPVSSVTVIVTVNGFFVVLFVLTALFFRYADQMGSAHSLQTDEPKSQSE